MGLPYSPGHYLDLAAAISAVACVRAAATMRLLR